MNIAKSYDPYFSSLYFVTRRGNKMFLYNMRYAMIKIVIRIVGLGLDRLEF
jgi:hypothetical protein